MWKLVEIFLKKHYPLLFISLVGLILIILPFLWNNIEGFDAAGQYANTYYLRHYFYPWPDGWNSQLLSGFPQGIFYPSFFHWLAATLSFIIPLKLALKLLIGLAIAFFPITFFILSKKLLKNTAAANTALIITGIFYYFDLGINSNLFAGLYFGLFPYLFSLTLFLFYLIKLAALVANPSNWRLAGFLLALTIVTHPISGLMGILFGLIALFVSKKNVFIKNGLIKHLLSAGLLSIWWWLPALINGNHMSGSDPNNNIAPLTVLLIPFILLINLAVWQIKNEWTLFFKALSIFSSIILGVCLAREFSGLTIFPLHFSRFLVYPLLLTSLPLIYLLSSYKINWQKINLALIFSFSFYIFFFRLIPVGPFDTKILNNLKKYQVDSRIVVSGNSRYIDDRFHVTRMKLAMEQQLLMSEGLFVESSANGWFIMSIMKSWDDTIPSFVWAYNDLEGVSDLKWGAKIFGIGYEYRISDEKPSSENKLLLENKKNQSAKKSTDSATSSTRTDRNLDFKINRKKLTDNEKVISLLTTDKSPFYYQSFYKINETSVAEALALRPINITSNWKNSIIKWWTSDWLKTNDQQNYNKPILIYQTDTSSWNLPPNNLNLPVIEAEGRMDNFIVDASSLTTSSPIYVKVGYFPFWQARDENGQKLKIHKASPNFMLVYGRGLINFSYVKPWYYYAGFIISALTMIVLLVGLVIKNKKINLLKIFPIRKKTAN